MNNTSGAQQQIRPEDRRETQGRLDAADPHVSQNQNKCEPDDLVYTSYPPQHKCKNCGKFWFIKDGVPNCTNTPQSSQNWEILYSVNKKMMPMTQSEELTAKYFPHVLAFIGYYRGNDLSESLVKHLHSAMEKGKVI